MKLRKIILIFIIAIILLSGCRKEEKTLQPVNQDRVTSINNLTYDLFKYSFNSNDNLLLSPYSLYELMTMLYNAAEGNTEKQIQEFFTLQTKEESNQIGKDIRENLINSKEILSISNGVFLDKNTIFSSRMNDEFIKPLKDYYNAEVKDIIFNNNTVNIINNWVKDKTKGMITKLIDEVPEDAVMYVLNAIYFKGDWKYQFEEKNTFKREFNQTTVDMMHIYENEYLYYSEDNVQTIQLPYQDEYAMNIYLTSDGIYDDIDLALLTGKLNQSSLQKIAQLALPKFTYETDLILFNDYLSSLDIFHPMTNLDIIGEDTYVSKIMHKAKIIVNEKGTEAAAVTGAEIENSSAPVDVTNFIVDKPFIYTIVHKKTGTILFIGYMNEI